MAEIAIMGELLVEIMRPHDGVPLRETDYFRGPFPSGAPGIFISTAARLGHSASIISGVGKDDFGETILDRLKKDGVDIRNVLVSDEGNTGVAFVTYYEDGSRQFLFYTKGSPAVMAKMPINMDSFSDTRYLHVMGCSLMADKTFGKEILKLMYYLKKNGVTISFDPNVRIEMMKDPDCMKPLREVLDNCTILMPGVSELKMLVGLDSLDRAIAKAFENPSLEFLVLKNGSKGSRVYDRSGLVGDQGVYRVKQVDPTGAGDSFDAAFICGLAEGRTVLEAAQIGAAAGALDAAAFGPMEGNINPENIQKMIREGGL